MTLYDSDIQPSIIIVGLGNTGSSYERTRHNAGWWAVDTLSEAFGEGEWKDAPKFLSQTQEARIVTVPVLFVKPQTLMNRSGEAVQKMISYYKLTPSTQVLILSDDIDLPLGELRFRHHGGPGTHNGLKSVVEHVGAAFPRLRIGLGQHPLETDLANWVLSTPPEHEREILQESLKKVPDLVRSFVLEDGSVTAS